MEESRLVIPSDPEAFDKWERENMYYGPYEYDYDDYLEENGYHSPEPEYWPGIPFYVPQNEDAIGDYIQYDVTVPYHVELEAALAFLNKRATEEDMEILMEAIGVNVNANKCAEFISSGPQKARKFREWAKYWKPDLKEYKLKYDGKYREFYIQFD